MTIWQKNDKTADNMMIWKKRCQMTEIQKCTLQFDTKTSSVEFCQHAVLDWDFKQSGSQIHAWILLKKKYNVSEFILFFAGQVFFTVNGLL